MTTDHDWGVIRLIVVVVCVGIILAGLPWTLQLLWYLCYKCATLLSGG